MSGALATLDDYAARHGVPSDVATTAQRLIDASSLVRLAARLHLSAVENDTITVDGDGTRTVFLPEFPVTAITSVTVDGEELDPSLYRWWSHGKLQRRHYQCWPNEPRALNVVYSHGFDPVAPWIVGLVCSMVQRAGQPWATQGIRAEALGDHQVSYQAATAGGAMVWITADEAEPLHAIRGPVL